MAPIIKSPKFVDKVGRLEDIHEHRRHNRGDETQDHLDTKSTTNPNTNGGTGIQAFVNVTSPRGDLDTGGNTSKEFIIEVPHNGRLRNSTKMRVKDDVEIARWNGMADAELDVYPRVSPTGFAPWTKNIEKNALSKNHWSQTKLNQNPSQLSESFRTDSASDNSHLDTKLVHNPLSTPLARHSTQSIGSTEDMSNLLKHDHVIPHTVQRSLSKPIDHHPSPTIRKGSVASAVKAEVLVSGSSLIIAPSLFATPGPTTRSRLALLSSLPQGQMNKPSLPTPPNTKIEPPLRIPPKSAKFYITVPPFPDGLTKEDYSWPPQPALPNESKSTTNIPSKRKTGTGKRKKNDNLEPNTLHLVEKLQVIESRSPPSTDTPPTYATTSASDYRPGDIESENYYEEYVCPPPILELDPDILEARIPVSNTAILLSTRYLYRAWVPLSNSPPLADPSCTSHFSIAQDMEDRLENDPFDFLSTHFEEHMMLPHTSSTQSQDEATTLNTCDFTATAPGDHPPSRHPTLSNHLENPSHQPLPQVTADTDDYYVPSIDDAILEYWVSSVPTFEEQPSYVVNGTVDPSLLGGIQAQRSPSPSPPPFSQPRSSPPAVPQPSRQTSRRTSTWKAPLMDPAYMNGSDCELDIKGDMDDGMFYHSRDSISQTSSRRSSKAQAVIKGPIERNPSEAGLSIAGPSTIGSRNGSVAAYNHGSDSFSQSASQRGRGRGRGRGSGRGRGRGRGTSRRGTSQSTSNITSVSDPESNPQILGGSNSVRERGGRGTAESRALAPPVEEKVYCHQCRRATDAEKMTCTKMLAVGVPCRRKYCILCILKRYPDIEFNSYATMFTCPSCTNTCNCTACCGKRNEPYISTRSVKIDKKTLDMIGSGEAPGTLPSASAEYMRQSKHMNWSNPQDNQHVSKENRPSLRGSQLKLNAKQPKANGSQSRLDHERSGTQAVNKTGRIIESSGGVSGEYWAAVFSVTGDRIGAGYIGNTTTQIIVKPTDDDLQPKKKKSRIYVGQLQASWGFEESGEEIEPDEPPVSGKGKGKARAHGHLRRREYVGDRSMLFWHKDKSLHPVRSFTKPPAPPPIAINAQIQEHHFDFAELGSDADAEGEDDEEELERNHWLMGNGVDSPSPIRPPPMTREMCEEDVKLAIFRAIDAVNAEENSTRSMQVI